MRESGCLSVSRSTGLRLLGGRARGLGIISEGGLGTIGSLMATVIRFLQSHLYQLKESPWNSPPPLVARGK